MGTLRLLLNYPIHRHELEIGAIVRPRDAAQPVPARGIILRGAVFVSSVIDPKAAEGNAFPVVNGHGT